MTHDHHEAFPGYHEDQILFDGCAECGERAARADHGVGDLDPVRFGRAWARALCWEKHGLANVSDAEMPLLRTLNAVRVQLDRSGVRA